MKREFLHQMEIEYDRRNLVSESIARKIRDLMTVSVIMIAAITAFYGHMWSVTEERGPYFHLPMISVAVLGVATVLCVVSNRVEVKRTVFLGVNMTAGSEIREDVVKSWTDASEDEFYASLIREYLLCLKEAESAVRSKAVALTVSIILFSAGSILFPPLVAISLTF